MNDIKTVTVIGANGAMGSNVSAMFASFGNAKVYMVSRSIEDSHAAAEKAALSVKAGTVRNNLIPVDYSSLDYCLSVSDFVFESVSENEEIKKQVYYLMHNLKENVIISSGTSGLSINKLKKYLPENVHECFFGVHMFNPPYSMPLCELIPSDGASLELTEQLSEYLSEVLRRKVVTVKDTPAFLGNRIGFHFINSALLLAEKYKDNGGIDYIDAIFGGFTGRNMPPIVTADFVGLDVYKAIVDNLYENTADYQHEYFKTPDFAEKLISNSWLGRKSGKGFYSTVKDGETKKRLVYDIALGDFREIRKYNIPFVGIVVENLRNGNYKAAFDTLQSDKSQEAQICKELLISYVIYSLFSARESGCNASNADTVMAEGFNWVPPMALVKAFGGKEKLLDMIRKEFSSSFENIDYETLILSAEFSDYDYRRYLKAKR
ncbi:MAG: 3-hydroxyacyl-CoA dehydrogenase family protein [Clostridia bacterium]|nr:3-hydroxyacyl-CoA dehydrogenase family protein [Clostridia bacterium]MBR6619242.1 3-hydroxyacyl-CoA dehydrogenase family protein [Clostridia bacterium]